jgi:CDGSH-type Zn-finger protein
VPNKLSIQVFPNGPMEVRNATSVRFGSKDIETDGSPLYICRCGQSANAPFCDGTHSKIGFDGGCEAPKHEDVRLWQGKTIRTVFNPNACMHVFNCKPLKELRARELAGDATAAADIIRVIGTCPSGALSYETTDDVQTPESPALPTDVEIMEGGEVRIQRDFDINASIPGKLGAERATLCRCGDSKNKPWCDGRHKGRKNFR